MDTKHFRKHSCLLTWASSLPAKLKLGPFYAKGQCGLSQLEGPSSAKAPGLGELWLPCCVSKASSTELCIWCVARPGRWQGWRFSRRFRERLVLRVLHGTSLSAIFMFIFFFCIMPNWQKKTFKNCTNIFIFSLPIIYESCFCLIIFLHLFLICNV